jgi:micrococcal nuclease
VRRVLPLLVLAVLAGALGRGVLHGSSSGTSNAPGGTARPAHVVRVVDGDTIVARVGGREERVRYIGMDTPETVKPRTPVQCFGKRASAENRRLVAGRDVQLVVDAEERDRYGRLLAYVFRRPDGLLVNAELVRRGFATPLTIPPNVRYAERFRSLAQEARRAGRGLWQACAR